MKNRLKKLFVFSVLLITTIAGRSQQKQPNIILILADDLGYQAVSAYGYGLNSTPHIDRIANEGIQFSRCLVTNSVCGPSRAAILTGKYSHANGFYMNERGDFDGSQMTFPKLLRQKGYQTAIIGKWHLGSKPTGFDHWEVMPGQGFYYNPDFTTKNGDTVVPGYSTDIIREKSIDWLENQRDKSKPFMLMMQFKAPHREWEPGPKDLNKYDNHIFPEPSSLFDDYSGRASPAKNQQMTIKDHMVLEGDNHLYNNATRLGPPLARSYPRMTDAQKKIWDRAYELKNKAFYHFKLKGDDITRWKYQRYMQDYMAVVASIDENVGKLLTYLDEHHLSENTLLVFTSDQGFFLGEHGWFDKRWMYEESFRTPLLMRWPSHINAGNVSDRIVSNLDLAETFLNAAGISVPNDMQGASLLPLFDNKKKPNWRNSFYYHYYEGGGHGVPVHEGVYKDSLKLINYYSLNEWEMFDLRRDPHEMRSVYDNPEYAEKREMLKRELADLRKKLKVPSNPK